ncbi:hypothetical protein [Cupriavidus taiwanensis]|uniref:hypothetical protein n=1 Tax=Cupriavidus taiwanensis TaxID=164546 RepID=UPI000E10E62C|nr:hypothetical protein [Cupriavidus taiwanensis]SPA56691.1 conserved protein of unknown function [Cupriavidus taiwanensis]
MSTDEDRSQVFLRGNEDGPSRLPGAVAQMLARLSEGAVVISSAELEALGWAVADECLGEPQNIASANLQLEEAIRGLLRALGSWKRHYAGSLSELNVLLTAVNALDMRSTGLKSVASSFANSALEDGLAALLDGLDVGPMRGLDRHLPNVREELKTEALKGSYKRLHQIASHLMPEPPPGGWAAIILLWKLDPDKLALVLSKKDDVFFSLFVRLVLREDTADLALRTSLLTFKFIAVDQLEGEYRGGRDSNELRPVLERLLAQVAQTKDWSAWMKELFASPDEKSLLNQVLPLVLARLDEPHWQAVVDAVHLRGMKRSARAVAEVMATFSNEVAAIKANKLWAMFFDRWNEWDYGRGEEYSHLFAPAVCAFDYPVTRYYSQMAAGALAAEEAALATAVEGIERQWFASFTDLVTERNRLLSRLRLVRHGRELSKGASELLPPLPMPSDTYSQVRYRYYDSQY